MSPSLDAPRCAPTMNPKQVWQEKFNGWRRSRKDLVAGAPINTGCYATSRVLRFSADRRIYASLNKVYCDSAKTSAFDIAPHVYQPASFAIDAHPLLDHTQHA